MNRGSCLKWIELLLAEKNSYMPKYYLNDGWGLKWQHAVYSPVGVLEDFITKEWNKDSLYSGCFTNKEGNTLLASQECLKKVKAKTNLEVIDDLWYKLEGNRKQLCFLIEFNQETL